MLQRAKVGAFVIAIVMALMVGAYHVRSNGPPPTVSAVAAATIDTAVPAMDTVLRSQVLIPFRDDSPPAILTATFVKRNAGDGADLVVAKRYNYMAASTRAARSGRMDGAHRARDASFNG